MDKKRSKLYALFFHISLDETTSQLWKLMKLLEKEFEFASTSIKCPGGQWYCWWGHQTHHPTRHCRTRSLHLVSDPPSGIDPVPLNVQMKVLLQLLPKRNLSSVLSASLVFLVCLFLGESWSKPLSWKFSRTFIQDSETCASLCTSPSTQMWLQFKLTPSVPCS